MENPKYKIDVDESYIKLQPLITQISSEMEVSHPKFGTVCVHAGCPPDPMHGSINPPIHLSSTFALKSPTQAYSNSIYLRVGTPTSDALGALISKLEYGNYTRCYSSGVAAATALFSLFSTGDHIILFENIYGGTHYIAHEIFKKKFKFEIDLVDMTDLEEVRKAIKPNTKMIWIETPSNPTMKIVDIEAICDIAKEQDHKIITVVDNTFATPYNQNPLKLGADISFNSLTKYIGGHCDLVAGSLTMNEKSLYSEIFQLSHSEEN